MAGGVRGRLSMAACALVVMAIAATGCGGDDDESTAQEHEAKAPSAREPAKVFITRMTKLLETTKDPKDCAEIHFINGRSSAQFECPAAADLRKSMAKFEIVGAKEYGTGAVVDYKSGKVKDGAAIVLFVAPDRNWGIGRFGLITEPSTQTSDSDSREGYDDAIDKYLTAVRDRDCKSYYDITFNGDDKQKTVCEQVFPQTKELARRLKTNPDAKPRYEGGNETYGFYSVETAKPKPSNMTISIAKASDKSSVPYLVLDVTRSPTAAQQRQAQKALEKKQKPNQDMKPSSKPVES